MINELARKRLQRLLRKRKREQVTRKRVSEMRVLTRGVLLERFKNELEAKRKAKETNNGKLR